MRSSSIESQPDLAGDGGSAAAGSDAPGGFPQVFGKYVLVRPMARGGMGELFIAAAGETDGFEKLCVVKKVLHSLEDAAVHRRFLDEAKVVVRLNHANLVQVFDAGRVDNEYYLAMELVEGKDLRAVWNRCAQLHRRIPVDVAIFVIREVLRGLDYVHDAMGLDLVHRDISPPNLLVGYRGEVKLTDFGLAKSAIKREMTSPGVVFGRYSYLSPEQAKGLPADRRTDIYACGIVLWELLTGRQLFPSSNRSHREALDAVRNPKIRAPSSLVPGVPDGLDEIVLRALRQDPKNRYQTAGQFRSASSVILARDFPTCDADRVSDFMRDIFARENKDETRDYANYSQQEFGDLRAQADHSDQISISDVIDLGLNGAPTKGSTIPLGESDIVELDGQRFEHVEVSPKSLRESAREWVGQVIGRKYRIDTLLGIGGMGAVFRVTHLALGKPFALKVLHRVYTRDSDIISRFMREARAATQTGHPNIIDVLDIGTTEDGDVYFVMELLEGHNVGDVINNEGPLAVRRAVHIARQICKALSAAHEVGIIHRDLKSENVILTLRGKDPDFVKVLDFGICKQMNADSSTTSPGLVMGSPDYMAPEQGAGLEATVASDVYAVGCIVFEMLAGRLPFQGRNAVDVLMQKGAREAPRVTSFRPEIPEPLATVISRCLERQVSDRPQSMRSLEYELTRAVDGRATAVAAVLGLPGSDSLTGGRATTDPTPNASASMQRAAVAAMDGGYGPAYAPQERTQIAPPPQAPGSGPVPLQRPPPKHSSPVVAAAKALLFVTLGGLLAGGVLLAVSPETLTGEEDAVDGKSNERGAPADAEPTPEPPPEAKAVAPPKPLPGQPPAPKPKPGEPDVIVDDGGDVEPDLIIDDTEPTNAEAGSPEELVAMAEEALESGKWTEPPEQSMALALSKLAIVDPSNEALGRLHRAATERLVPIAEKAVKRKQWADAASAYRNLAAVYPDHPDAIDNLVSALHGLNRRQRRARDFEGALATADELHNLRPDDHRVTLTRADMLSLLGRWDEAKDAYAEVRKIKPRSKAAKKGFWRAVKMSRKDKGKKPGLD